MLVISLTVLQTVMLLSVIPCMMIASTALRIISCNLHAVLLPDAGHGTKYERINVSVEWQNY